MNAITSASVYSYKHPLNTKPRDLKSQVHATFEDGSKKVVLSFFSDEIQITPDEVIGLTEDQVLDLFHAKDVAYIRGY